MRGTNGYRIRSSPVLKQPGGKPVLDVHLEESERADYHFQFGASADNENQNGEMYSPGSSPNMSFARAAAGGSPVRNYERRASTGQLLVAVNEMEEQEAEGRYEEVRDKNMELVEHMKSFAEMFVFSYGVVVFWNFTERQEKVCCFHPIPRVVC